METTKWTSTELAKELKRLAETPNPDAEDYAIEIYDLVTDERFPDEGLVMLKAKLIAKRLLD